MKSNQTIDLSFTRAARVMPRGEGGVRFFLVGCGGTGSFLAPSIARLAASLISAGQKVGVAFIDHDRVEDTNIPRQNFCYAEEGEYKAITLATRLTRAWNVPITAVTERFEPDMLDEDWGGGMRSRNFSSLHLLIGCVDNAAARRAMSRALSHNSEWAGHHIWWLDCGNSNESGQVLLGSAPNAEAVKGAFRTEKVCNALPSPALQAPDLLRTRPEETSKQRLSCAELMILNEQSLMVNQQVAAIASDYLMRMTTVKPLRKFATYFDQESGVASSKYVTPEQVGKVIKRSPEFLMFTRTATPAEFLAGRTGT